MSKKVVNIHSKSKILKSRSQSEIIAERRKKRKKRIDSLLKKG
ncbi:hypothetical protein JOC75_004353 [Metabacillus crassostreae]|nr:hypothetical protein [Metabacillus crassostreae]MBM7606305.1 hypothetical protein [Metabacillus crassostreae]